VYEITPAGRRALQAWLATEPAAPRFEIEAVLRLLFADHGSKEDVLRAVRSISDWAAGQARIGWQQCQEYLDGDGPFPERLHVIVPFALLFAGFFETLLTWSDQVTQSIGEWPGTRDVGMTDATRRRLEEMMEKIKPLIAGGHPG
jgi:hypothetical protein